MNTPAHALVNLLALSGGGRERAVVPVTVGSLLPDVPMICFYAWQRLVAGTPEMVIWREHYHEPAWQGFFDLFNSLPLIALAWLIGRAAGWQWLMWVAAGMALHVAFDLPVHHDDGHRHLFPLSDWRFDSPVSYWNVAHYGQQMSLLEVGLCGFAVAWLWWRHRAWRTRLLVTALAAAYAGHWVFVFAVWA